MFIEWIRWSSQQGSLLTSWRAREIHQMPQTASFDILPAQMGFAEPAQICASRVFLLDQQARRCMHCFCSLGPHCSTLYRADGSEKRLVEYLHWLCEGIEMVLSLISTVDEKTNLYYSLQFFNNVPTVRAWSSHLQWTWLMALKLFHWLSEIEMTSCPLLLNYA